MAMIATYEQAVAYLETHIGRGMRPGLERITGLLDLMGRPDQAYPIIQVAGTNGKTSTSRMATMLLAAHGLTTGTFVSPHLERVEERIALNGFSATPDQLVQAVADVAAFGDIYEQNNGAALSYFELTAAMAFAFFANESADAAVIEVGLGGRLDATNACSASVAVLTQVGLDHQEYLGDTVELIAAEKLGILEPGATLVTGPLDERVWPIVDEAVARSDATEWRFGREFGIEGASRAVRGWHLDLAGVHANYEDLVFPVSGRHQMVNLSMAVAATEALMGRSLDLGAVQDATSVLSTPGRMEAVASSPFVLLDGAHNPDGFIALADALREEFPTTTWVLVTSVMSDKDAEAMYPRLAGLVEHVVVTQTPGPNARPADDLAATMRPLIGAEVEAEPDIAKALGRARTVAGKNGNVLVAGSLYLAGAVRSLILAGGDIHPNER